jgi:hypothetical protein
VRPKQLAKETKAIAALKQHYERYHGKDLAALKELYEYHAANSVRAAELTGDTQQREEYLKLALEWTEAANKVLDLLRSQETDKNLEKLRKARARSRKANS